MQLLGPHLEVCSVGREPAELVEQPLLHDQLRLRSLSLRMISQHRSGVGVPCCQRNVARRPAGGVDVAEEGGPRAAEHPQHAQLVQVRPEHHRRPPVGHVVRALGLGASLEQRGRAAGVATHCAHHQRREAALLGKVDAGARGQQHRHARHRAVLRSYVQRSPARGALLVDVGPRVEERLERASPITARRGVECRGPLLVGGVHIGARAQQPANADAVVPLSRQEQQRRPAVTAPGECRRRMAQRPQRRLESRGVPAADVLRERRVAALRGRVLLHPAKHAASRRRRARVGRRRERGAQIRHMEFSC
eukprot:scaffold1179_cov118-Isochrysis_galbana.AAC.2